MAREKTFGLHKSVEEIFSHSLQPDADPNEPTNQAETNRQPAPSGPDEAGSDQGHDPDILETYETIFTAFTEMEPPSEAMPEQTALVEAAPSTTRPQASPHPFDMARFMADPDEERPSESDKAEQALEAVIDTVNRLKKDVPCEKDYACEQTKFQALCQAKLILHGRLLKCLESRKHKCKARSRFFGYHLCTCKIRYYLAKSLPK